MMHADVLVIGAGASGLMAAKELSAKGKKVIVLEARKRAGGRIHTLPVKHFSQPVEAGAEFIHGNLPVTLQLLEQNGIPFTTAEGSMLRKRSGAWLHTEEEVVGWDEMMQKMNSIKEDMTLADFLNTFFSADKYAKLRQSAVQFANGFDGADESKASILALRHEWQHEQDQQYRIDGGYMRLIDAMTAICLTQKCEVHFSEPVNKINWGNNKVVVTTTHDEQFSAEKIVITVPVGVLQTEGAITFMPAIADKMNAAKDIGLGGVIKVLMEFEEAFWEDIQPNALFFFSEEQIPTWWTQHPEKNNLLTGWLGGPKVLPLQNATPEEILNIALRSVQNLFNMQLPSLKAWHVANWQQEPYSCGAYSYNTIHSQKAKAVLKAPVENTLFFAGEALYSGDAQGTVEAALVSGKEAAVQVLKSYFSISK